MAVISRRRSCLLNIFVVVLIMVHIGAYYVTIEVSTVLY